MKPKHTPGPWHLEYCDKNIRTYRVRANLSHRKHEATEESIGLVVTEANARLIATAPELLEALQKLISYAEIHGDMDECLRDCKARAAVFKATGGDREYQDVIVAKTGKKWRFHGLNGAVLPYSPGFNTKAEGEKHLAELRAIGGAE